MTERMFLHKLMALVNRKGQVSITEAARALKTDERYMMEVAKILKDANIVDTIYAVSGDVIVKPGRCFRQALDETVEYQDSPAVVKKAVLDNSADERACKDTLAVNDFLVGVRREIAGKRRVGSDEKPEVKESTDEKKA